MSATRVIAAAVRRNSSLLVCQRPAHKRHGGLWEFPGGKCEAGETDFDTAHRELSEELAVQVLSAGDVLLEVADHGSPFVIAFLPVEIAGEPKCLEHDALLWAEPGALLNLPLAPSDRRFVEFLLASAP